MDGWTDSRSAPDDHLPSDELGDSDRLGIPLGVAVDGANRNDSVMLAPTLDEFFDEWGQPLGPSQVGPDTGKVTAFYGRPRRVRPSTNTGSWLGQGGRVFGAQRCRRRRLDRGLTRPRGTRAPDRTAVSLLRPGPARRAFEVGPGASSAAGDPACGSATR